MGSFHHIWHYYIWCYCKMDSSKNKNKEKRAMVAEIMYDYDAVKRVLNVKELCLPLIFRKDYFSESAAGGIGWRGAHSCVRVFIAESELRSSSAVLDRLSWREFSVLYTEALRDLNNSR